MAGYKEMLELTDMPDPIEAAKHVEGRKYCTNCGLQKEYSFFHVDEQKPDGYRDVCKECRSNLNEERKRQRLDVKIKKMEEENLSALDQMASGGSFDPDLNEVFEAIMRPFGGVNGFAKNLYATYLVNPPGSQKRIKIQEMIVRMADKVTQLGLAERRLELMEEQDLMQIMRKHLNDYQQGNNLPGTAIPTLSGNVVDIEARPVEVPIESAEEPGSEAAS